MWVSSLVVSNFLGSDELLDALPLLFRPLRCLYIVQNHTESPPMRAPVSVPGIMAYAAGLSMSNCHPQVASTSPRIPIIIMMFPNALSSRLDEVFRNVQAKSVRIEAQLMKNGQNMNLSGIDSYGTCP